MDSLETALASMIASLRSESTAIEDVPLLQLTRLPPTDEIRASLASQRDALARLGTAALGSTQEKSRFVLTTLERRLALCERRDAIQAARPPGCWCLGVGGTEIRYIPPWDGGEAEAVFGQYCVCAEAVAAKAKDDIARAHYQANRRAYRAMQLFAKAGVPSRLEAYSFETFPVGTAMREAMTRIRAWVAEPPSRSLLLYGPFGTGKTGLAVSAMRRAVAEHEIDALFLATPDLLDRIRASYGPRDEGEPSERELMDAVKDTGLLVLDDLGAERPTGWVQEKLFALINHRYNEQAPCIFTSNLTPEQLAKHLGERTAWRIIEMSDVVKVDGPNLRDRKGA